MNFYRFRSIERLLGESQELEKQSIYFASPGQLNDPMEGFRDIFWQGDKIVWTNLFKHYLSCLKETCHWLVLVGDRDKWEPDHIPVLKQWNQHPTPVAADLFNDIWKRVFEKENLDSCISKIASMNRKSRRAEVLFYLRSVHFTALLEIKKLYIQNGFITDDNNNFTDFTVFKLLDEREFFENLQKMENEDSINALFEVSNLSDFDIGLLYKYNSDSTSKNMLEKNNEIIQFDFVKNYLDQLNFLLYPKWYAACFMRDYQNSSVWGHYGDNHRGICLIFEAESTEEGQRLTLNGITGYGFDGKNKREHWGSVPMPFYEINYVDKAGEIDFFRSLGQLTRYEIRNSWYSDQEGNLSECSTHGALDGDTDSWREIYWKNFYRDITIKTKDWKYEQESRLILTSIIDNLDDERKRTLTYEFNSLKGIIFGINTSDTDKLKIIEIILRKCREHNRTDFKFYQAYYSHKNGDIRRFEIFFGNNLKNMNQATA